MKDTNAPIGVFDSGLGGLTVVREIIRQIPAERIVYFGDTARVPYGSKSKDTVIRFTDQILRFLDTKDVKALVVACNTISAFALEAVRPHVHVPIIGVLKPGARTAVAATKNKKIGVMGTEGTVASDLYRQFIEELDPAAEVSQQACPLLVPLVEEGWWHDAVTDAVLKRYLQNFRDAGVDTVIMGCTHYPLLRSAIRGIMGEDVNLVNPAYETAIELRKLLEEQGLLREESSNAETAEGIPAADSDASQKDIGKYRFYVSDAPEKFTGFAASVLKMEIPMAEKVNIEAF